MIDSELPPHYSFLEEVTTHHTEQSFLMIAGVTNAAGIHDWLINGREAAEKFFEDPKRIDELLKALVQVMVKDGTHIRPAPPSNPMRLGAQLDAPK